MSTTALQNVRRNTDISILCSNHMSATVDTASGSRYTVIARPNVGVVLIHDDKGWARKAARIQVIRGRMFLFDANGQVVASTTVVTNIFIISN